MQLPCAFRPAARILRLALALALVGLAACGGKNLPKVYPVKGKVLVNSKPAKDCQVWFHPTGGDLANRTTPHGLTDDSGEFQLTSYIANDGAAEGEYIVTIEWRERSGLAKMEFEGPDQLGEAYSKSEKTKGLKGFVVQVGPRAMEVPPFELTQSAEAKRKLEEAKKQKPGFGGPLQ